MRASGFFLVVVAAGAALFFHTPAAHTAVAAGTDLLSGQVSSADEPAMEGVLVSAKKEGFDHFGNRCERSAGALPLSRRPS